MRLSLQWLEPPAWMEIVLFESGGNHVSGLRVAGTMYLS
jgi:hypothetical protein